jgi:hypothetical protein
MKTIIAGGRNYTLTDDDRELLDLLRYEWGITEVVSGCATGADSDGEKWARENGITVKRFSADWSEYGRRAGPIRNTKMAEYANALVAFPGGRGTANMIFQAKIYGLRIFVKKINEVKNDR